MSHRKAFPSQSPGKCERPSPSAPAGRQYNHQESVQPPKSARRNKKNDQSSTSAHKMNWTQSPKPTPSKKHRLQITIEKSKITINSFHSSVQRILVNKASEHKIEFRADSIGDLIRNLQIDLQTLASELKLILAPSKNAIHDKRENKEALSILFQGADLIEQYLADGCNRRCPLDNGGSIDVVLVSTMLWNDIDSVISSSLQNQNDAKYTPRKASLIKLLSKESQELFLVLVKPIASLSDVQWSMPNSTRQSDDNGPVTAFRNKQNCDKMISLLHCLRAFITGYCFNLHSEDHIGRLVESVIIPILVPDPRSISGEGGESVSIQHILSVQTATMDCVVRILRWKQCSSAILAPLVLDVDANGEEQLKANPLREKLLRTVVTIINCDVYLRSENTSWLCYTCQCLTSLLGNANVTGSTKSEANGSGTGSNVSDQVQIANIFKWVHKTLQCDVVTAQNERSLRWYSLDLLKTVISLCPKACAQYWSLFLPQLSSSHNPTSPPRGNNAPSASRTINLMSIMSLQDIESAPSSSEERSMAMLCCKEILEALPLRLWSRSGYLTGRIESSLEEVIASTTQHLSKSNPIQELESCYFLAVTLLTVMPYSKYELLVEPAVGLMNQIGRNYSMYGLHGGLGLETTVKALADCLGGKETPNGQISPLPIPAREWLRRPISSNFVSHIFNKMSEISQHEVIVKGIQTTLQMNLFVRVVRSAAWILIEDSSRIQAFIELTNILLQSDDRSLKVTGARLVKAFIEGRISSSREEMNEVAIEADLPFSLYTKMHNLLKEQDTFVRCSVLSTYSSLSFTEWRVMLPTEYNPLLLMLPMALEYSGDSDGRVRSETCKALGHIMTVFMRWPSSLQLDSPSRVVLNQNIKETIQVTASAMEDSDATVRSMVSDK